MVKDKRVCVYFLMNKSTCCRNCFSSHVCKQYGQAASANVFLTFCIIFLAFVVIVINIAFSLVLANCVINTEFIASVYYVCFVGMLVVNIQSVS